MRDHILTILRHARNAIGRDPEVTLNLLVHIETEAMAALQGDKTIISSRLFGEIPIPQNVITAMSNGDHDLWFSHGCALDVNVHYTSGWHWDIHPVKNGETDTDHLIEKGKL